jgi:hypothetical protein
MKSFSSKATIRSQSDWFPRCSDACFKIDWVGMGRNRGYLQLNLNFAQDLNPTSSVCVRETFSILLIKLSV